MSLIMLRNLTGNESIKEIDLNRVWECMPKEWTGWECTPKEICVLVSKKEDSKVFLCAESTDGKHGKNGKHKDVGNKRKTYFEKARVDEIHKHV